MSRRPVVAAVRTVVLLAATLWPAATAAQTPPPASAPLPPPPVTIVDTVPSCPTTRPNGSTPPGESPSPGYHGNGAVWTSFEPRVVFEPGGPGSIGADGSLAIKWPWWWAVPGKLGVQGRRLDAPAPPLRAEAPGGRRLDLPLPTSGEFQVVDSTPNGFSASALIFPAAGCWEVIGTVGDGALTFVVLVVRLDEQGWPTTGD